MEGLDALARLLREDPCGDAKSRCRAYLNSTARITTRKLVRRGDNLFAELQRGSGLILTADGYFVTNHHVFDIDTAVIEFHTGLDAEHVYATKIDARLMTLEEYDLTLGKCSIPAEAKKHIIPPVFANTAPHLRDIVRVYAFKEDIQEVRGHILGKQRISGLCVDDCVETDLERCTSCITGDGVPLLESAKEVLWFSDAKIEYGFSGGPVVDKSTGMLLGITALVIKGERLSDTAHEHGYIAVDGLRKLLSIYLRTQGFAIP